MNDADCPADAQGAQRCNTALAEPTCQRVACGSDNSICHTQDVCASGMQCIDGACNPCSTCGDQCKVDFQTDAKHCGACNTPVGPLEICVEGRPACKANTLRCGDACVDVATDAKHCGACDTPVPKDAVCERGAPKCSVGYSLCGGKCVNIKTDPNHCGACGARSLCPTKCVDTSDPNNCGRCGNVCGAKTPDCRVDGSAPYCSGTVEVPERPGLTCDAVCQGEGLICRDSAANACRLIKSDGGTRVTTCSATWVEPFGGGFPVVKRSCPCSPR